MESMWTFFFAAFFLNSFAEGIYLPGVAPNDYQIGDDVPLLVNSLSSSNTVLPFDYYFESLHFCKPSGGPKSVSESLGSVLFGDRLYTSPFELQMRVNETCKSLCRATIDRDDSSFIREVIEEKYMVNMMVDGLPVARRKEDKRTHDKIYYLGFDYGSTATVDNVKKYYLNNHYQIDIQYHAQDTERNRVVGVLITPQSIFHDEIDKIECKWGPKRAFLEIAKDKETIVDFTYSVSWTPSETPWATRWDNYLHITDTKIHWFNLINSIVIVLFLSGLVAMILIRALHKDIARYNSFDEEAQEDFGWKLVHADVFRPPRHASWFSVLIGSGAHIFLIAATTLIFATLGFLSPSSRGSLSTVMLVFYICFSFISGYFSSRIYKMLNGEKWKKNVVTTIFFVPGIIFSIFLFLNFVLIGAKSSGALPFQTMFAFLALYFLISVPLCFIGAYYGLLKPKINFPVRTNQIPRQIPDQPYYHKLILSMFIGGLLPFIAIFIELYVIMNSIWSQRIYYVFGFLFMVFVILVITCSETIIGTMISHIFEFTYRWWRSFLTSASSGIYVFLYGILYSQSLDLKNFTSSVLFFGYMIFISSLFSIVTGTIGFFACFFFVRRMYSSIKID